MSVQVATPKKSAGVRPPLPIKLRNPLLSTIEKDPTVKYQIIEREGQEIVIGRVKVPTPGGGHAFILRRFDTGALSLTTMFRAAFPAATEADEKSDATWVKNAFDTSGANGGYTGANKRQFLRLAGTWLPPSVALAVAEGYGIGQLVKPLGEASPDMEQQFKKSSRANGETGIKDEDMDDEPAPLPARAPPSVKSPTSAPANKRRKASPSRDAPLSPPPTVANTRKLRSSKSPAPPPLASVTSPTKAVKPPSSRRGRKVAAEPEVEAVPEVAFVDPESDIEESKKIVEAVKSAYSKKPASAVTRPNNKRSQEEEKVTFEPKEPEIGDRVIAGPRRLRNLPPQRQAVAWGALALAVGFGLSAYLPQYFL